MNVQTRRIMSAGALAALLSQTACNKAPSPAVEGLADSGPSASMSASHQADAADNEAGTSAPTDGANRTGSILKHLPANCAGMKLYVDLQHFRRYRSTGADIAQVAGKVLARTDADEKFVDPVIDTLRDNGVNLASDLREVAACAESKGDWAALLSVDLKDVKTTPTNLLLAAATATGQPTLKTREVQGVKYVVPKGIGGALGFVAPGLLGYASSPELLAKAATSRPETMGVSKGEEQLATLSFPTGSKRGRLTLTGEPQSITADLLLPLNSQERHELKRDLGRDLTLLRDMVAPYTQNGALKAVQVPTLDQIAEEFDNLEMSITKKQLNAKVTVSIDRIHNALDAVANVKPDDFRQLINDVHG